MFTIKFLSVFIGSLFILETKQHSSISTVNDCIRTKCIDNESINDDGYSVRNRRMSDKLLVSKLIRDDEFVMQASSDRCRNNEQWNGKECIPVISVFPREGCPGGYHWNGNACIIQVLTKTAVLVPSGPDTKCALHSKIEDQTINSHSIQSLPSTVMPTYSTSPMCPFGFIWSDDKCIRNPPTCPAQYVFHENLCHLIMPAPAQIVEKTGQPFDGDAFHQSNNEWQRKPANMESKQIVEHEIENSAIEINVGNSNNQGHQHCCKIMSPRICRRTAPNRDKQWQCYHHQYKRCGDFCTKQNLYMRPKKPMFIEPLLIMPPPPRRLQKLMLNLAYRETNIDCSGCLNGTFGCSSECFAYDCNDTNCEFIDEDLLCGTSLSHDDDNSDVINDDYENNLYSDICAYSSK